MNARLYFLQSVPYVLKNLRCLAANVKPPIALWALTEALEGILGLGEAARPGFFSEGRDSTYFQFQLSPGDACR